MRNFIFTACVLSLSACKANEGGGTDTDTATSGTETTSVATAGTTGVTTTTTTETGGTATTTSLPTTTGEPGTTTVEPGTTTIEPGTTTVEPGTTTTGEPGTTTTGEPGTTTTTGEPGTTTTGGTTGEPVDCAALGPVQCADEPACMAIGGAKINLAKMCTAKPMFIECVAAAGCDDALTNGCDPAVMPPEPFLFNSTCLPTDWEVCEAPMNLAPCK